MYDSSDVWEGLFIELKNIFHRAAVKGNNYRPPRDININYQTFIRELTPILSAFEKHNNDTFNLSPSVMLDQIYTHSFAGFCHYVKNTILPRMILPALFRIAVYVKKLLPTFLTFIHLFHT